MLLEDAQQVVAASKRMLDAVRAGGVASTELRAALGQTRVFMAAGIAFQAAAVELIAAREQHGDGGVELLTSSAGLSQGEAHSQIKTAQALRKVPKLCDAVQSGEVSQANARRLADAITKTDPAAVAGDAELLQQAGVMRPEQFKHAVQRWITNQQADNGASEYARQRDRRYLRFYDTPDGMIALHGEFDKVTGTRISNRIRHLANKFFTNDQRLPKNERRQFPQCMADALDHSTTTGTSAKRVVSGVSGGRGSAAVNAARTSSASRTDTAADGTGSASGAGTTTGDVTCLHSAGRFDGCASNNNDEHDITSGGEDAAHDTTAADNNVSAAGNGDADVARGGWVADITLVAHVDDTTGELIAELSDGTRLPDAVLEELSCNARWTGLVYDRYGDAI